MPRPTSPSKPAPGAEKIGVGKVLSNAASPAAGALVIPEENWTLKIDDSHGVHARLFADKGETGQSALLLDLALTLGDVLQDLSGAQTIDIAGTTYAVRTEWLGDHYAFSVARDIGDGTFNVIAAGHADAALVGGTSHAIGFDAIQGFLASSSGALG